MHNARYNHAILSINTLVHNFKGIRSLCKKELQVYEGRFLQGWELPGLCDIPDFQLRLLIPPAFPYTSARMGVWPAPPILSWPHLEVHGLLCLFAESSNYSIDDVESVALTLIQDAIKLVQISASKLNLHEFEDGFQSYWNHWKNIHASMNVLCHPAGPSRWVQSYHTKKGVLIADDESILLKWMQNLSRYQSTAHVQLQAIPFLWLPRAPHPDEFPTNTRELFFMLERLQVDPGMVKQLLIDGKSKHKSVLMGFQGQYGTSFAGLKINDPVKNAYSGSPLTKGFRKQPPDHIVLMRYQGVPITGAKVSRYDKTWIHGRDHNPQSSILLEKSVIVFGVGSIGSSVAKLLAKSGVGKIVLVDPECLATENLSRHILGADMVNESKAKALAANLACHFPHLSIKGFVKTCDAFIQTETEHIHSTDLIISTVGNWGVESRLNAFANQAENFPPVLYGWTEPHATAGHAIVFFPRQGCLRCSTDDIGHNRIPVTAWPEQGTLLPVPSCGGQFQPYGAVELTHIHGLVADLAIDILLNQITNTTHRVWIGQQKLLKQTGGRWHQAWIKHHGDPGIGGFLFKQEFSPDPLCSECKSYQ